MLRTFISLTLALLGLASAHAQSARIDRIEIFERGIFQSETVKSVDDPSAAIGKRDVVTKERLVRDTTDVPAQLGIEFGIRYRIIGPRRGDQVSVIGVTKFPAQGLRNPARSETQFRDESVATETIGGSSYLGHRFDEAWEAVPGTWTFEIWQGNQKLAEQSFNVYRP